eukprot:CAMPEP_0170192856 /NCGR_PEP_ID=MMETSP0040_2-20121228/55416_1 /TAXON_ID=641309 /ORGANISM="Lotharella oceanica, Strain CCMP622" /LENGTH=95 /DNA_ID=CAMNT_0010441325 /DNA_START=38 /DNA_END=325 /DNA_ORIENTATION=-
MKERAKEGKKERIRERREVLPILRCSKPPDGTRARPYKIGQRLIYKEMRPNAKPVAVSVTEVHEDRLCMMYTIKLLSNGKEKKVTGHTLKFSWHS